MALNFPSSPSDGQQYTDGNGVTWTYTSATTSWAPVATAQPSLLIQNTTPTIGNYNNGQLWLNSDSGDTYVAFEDSDSTRQWILQSSPMNSQIEFSTGRFVRRQNFTATAGQTTFNVTGGYSPNHIDVFVNGVKLVNGTDVTVTSGTDVVLTEGANLNDVVDVVGYDAVSTISNTLEGDFTATGSIGSSVHPTNKNVIIGGDFTVNPWQRGTSFASATGYTADRFATSYVTSGVVSVLKTADAPTAAQAGVFTQHCFHVDVTTADASIAATDQFNVYHNIEGLNAARFGFGQSGTRYVTLSFWHKHTKTGTHCVALANSAFNAAYVKEYTQSVTNTWEKAEITFPVDTGNTWLYDTNIGLRVYFTLAAGSNYQKTADTWSGGAAIGTSNQVNNLDSTSNNFKIALVQLEAGDTATAFEARDAGSELILCQRYYQLFNTMTGGAYVTGGTGAVSYGVWTLTTQMRATPSVTVGTVAVASNATNAGVVAQTPSGGYSVAQIGATNGNYVYGFNNCKADAEL